MILMRSRRPAPADGLAGAVAEAREEIARTDAKAGTLLTLATGALAGLLTFAHAHIPLPAAAALWLAAALTTGALAVLLAVVRPRMVGGYRRNGGFDSHERLTDITTDDALRAWQTDRLRMFSALAVAKYRRVRTAVDLLSAALAVLAAAAALTAGGA